ncbi:hypothetical protein WHR41_05163 [Cladosporium halotolerans]|uniref:F-box domain-containing protein n=1 Tax=Cladosporium halotolerans TaxID=1052096 RepID=A0AB34KRT3_9PEZI
MSSSDKAKTSLVVNDSAETFNDGSTAMDISDDETEQSEEKPTHNLGHQLQLRIGEMSIEENPVNSEPESQPRANISFTLATDLWVECLGQPFRFLDLPPEVRNIFYELYFTGKHNISPPAITRACKLLRHETLFMHKAAVHTYQIPVCTPPQMNAFLKWVEAGDYSISCSSEKAFEFSFVEPGFGPLTVRFERKIIEPAAIFDSVNELCHALPAVTAICTSEEYAWMVSVGLLRSLGVVPAGFLQRFRPGRRIRDAVANRASCVVHDVSIVGDVPAFSEHYVLVYNPFDIARQSTGREWAERSLRVLGWFFFWRSIRARNQG